MADTPVASLEHRAASAVGGLRLLEPAQFTHVPEEQASLWRIRQGLFPSVGAARKRGTAVLIEDVAVPVERLADAVADLRQLFERHHYADAIIFGHAKDGNLHFVISQSFNDEAAVGQYARMMDEVVDLVVRRYDGALKAEHGTGRNIAPFVETEWGPEAYAIMRRVKALVDPDGILNPGVLITDDPRAHLAHLKTLPAVDDDRRPVHRVRLLREPVPEPRPHAHAPPAHRRPAADGATAERGRRRAPALGSIEADFDFEGLDTCAADGLCATACPVGIDTGALVKHLRTERHLPFAHRVADWAARHFATVETVVRIGLRVGGVAERVAGRPRGDGHQPTAWPRAPAAHASVAVRRCRARRPGGFPPPIAPVRRPCTSPRVCPGPWGGCRANPRDRRWRTRSSRSPHAAASRSGSRPTSRGTAAACRSRRRATSGRTAPP